MGEFKHFTRAELAGEAGVDPWQLDQSLKAGDPGKIDAIADGVHRAGVAAGEVDGDFESARKQFRDAWVSDGSHSPIDESVVVARITASVGAHRDQLRVIGTTYEEIAAALAKAQRDADADIGILEQQLRAVDAQMDAADQLAASDPSKAQTTLNFCRAMAVHFVQTAGSKVQGTRAAYAVVLADASTVLKANGAPPMADVPDLAAADPAAQQTTDQLKQLTDQAVLDQMNKIRSIQKELDAAAADAYVHGPGTAEGDASLAKVRQLKGELASALDDLGNIPDYSRLDPRAVTVGADGHLLGDYSVDGQPVQMYGQLKNGTGEIFDQAKQTTFTFKDGKLVGQTRLDPGRVTPDDELLFNAVTTAVGAPEAAAGVKIVGEAGVQGFKKLLGREGFDLAASGLTSENVIPRALAGAQLQADAAQARLSGLPHQFDPYPSGAAPGVTHDGLPPVGSGDHLPPVPSEHPALPLPAHDGPPVTAYAPEAPGAATSLNEAFVAGHPTADLAQQVADYSTHHVPARVGGDPALADRVVLGKWDGQDGGYIGEARHNGGIFFDTGDDTWNAVGHGLDPSQEKALGWQVNEQFLRTQLEAGVGKIEYVLPPGYDSVEQLAKIDRLSFSAAEINFLKENAAGFGYQQQGNSWVYVGGTRR